LATRDEQRPEAILFDAGGTLVLQDPAALTSRLGHPIEHRPAFEAHYRSMAAFARRRTAGRHDGWSWWQQHYFTALGVPEPETAGDRIDNGYGLWHLPIPGSLEALARLRQMGLRMAVVSNSDGSVGQSLTRAGFGELVEFVIDSHELGVAKPDPVIFQTALERMQLTAGRAWYVGDSIFHDMAGADAAGLGRAILVDPLGLHPEFPDRIGGVDELPEMVERLGEGRLGP
jgi:HAD superfamily hydrolase (TIGR01509 family)